VRVFADDGRLIADSDVIYDRLEERPLPEMGQPTISETIQSVAARVEYLRLTPWRPTISLETEHERAMRGEIVRGERLNEKGERVVSVTMPLRRVQQVMGTVTIESADVERILVAERASMIPFVLGATIAIFLSSLLLSLFIPPASSPRPRRRQPASLGRHAAVPAARIQAQGRDRRAGAFA